MLKSKNDIVGRKPVRLKYTRNMYPKDVDYMSYSFKVTSNSFNVWNDKTELETELVSLLCATVNEDDPYYISGEDYETTFIDSVLFNNFGYRKLFSYYFDDYASWDGSSDDYYYVGRRLDTDLKNCIRMNRYKWTNLYKSMILEFNPLWNVDAVEETTRTLEQDGTIETDRTGTDTTAHSGTITDAKSGKDTISNTGTDTTAYSGSETTAYSGSESDTLSGQDTVTKGGSVQEETANTTTESGDLFVATVKTTAPSDTETTVYGKSNTKSFTNRNDTKSFTNRQDQRTLNTEEETAFASQNQRTHNDTDTLTHNTNDTVTRDLLDTERIVLERHGNIGVTESTKLLSDFRNYVSFNLAEIIAHDIANSITQGVY